MKCPLCGSEKIIHLHQYDTKHIIDTYRDGFAVDIRAYFNSEWIELCQCGQCALQFFPEGVEGRSDFYEGMSKIPWYYMKDKYEYDYAIQMIIEKQPESILEIGCGKGYFLDRLKSGYQVRATEQNQEAIRELQSKGIELDDNHTIYDFVVMFQVLEHVKDVRPFLQWVIDKVKPGGYLLIAVPNPDSAYMREFSQITEFPPHHMNRISEYTFRACERLFPVKTESYFTEPICDVHLQQLIAERQKMFCMEGQQAPSAEILRAVEAAVLPLVREWLPFKGHTHGVLWRKL